jgi:hypothetical protein
MKPYTTKQAVENYLGVTIASGLNSQIDEWIDAMSRYIDGACNRVIFNDEEDDFSYDGDGSNSLIIKDCVDIEDVTIDGSSVEFFAYPANTPYKTQIKLESGVFPKGMQNVVVTAIQAHSKTLPNDVKFACTVLVAGIYNARNSVGKVGTTERIGNYSISYHTKEQKSDYETAKATLSAYRRIAI